MNIKRNQFPKRREFLKGGLRNIFLGFLLFIGGSLGWRNFGKSKNTENNLQSLLMTSSCAGCCQIGQCSNSLAVAFKKNSQTTGKFECSDFKRRTDGGEEQ
jgi:predicted negative regulator of RcsB-dependent stress response